MTDQGPDAPPPAEQDPAVPVVPPPPGVPGPQPVYGRPQLGYEAQPGYPPPSPAYGQPQPGFTAPYQAAPTPGYAPPQAAPKGPRTLGVVAFVLSVIAGVVVPVVAAIVAWRIGVVIGTSGVDTLTGDGQFDLAVLSPARNDVLVAELAFWTGTVLGIWAIVQGIVAIVKRRGTGFGITAIVIAAIGPLAYFLFVLTLLGAGAAAFVPANA